MKRDSSREPPVARLRDRMREATSAAILSAAEEVFATWGVQAARVEEIASRAGIAVGTLYNYFSDRDALLAALLQARRAELMARIDEAMAERKGAPFAQRLEGFLHAMFAHCEVHRAFMAILVQADQSGPRAPGMPHPKEAMLPIYRAAQELVTEGVSEGVLRPEGAEVYPSLIVGMLRGVILRELDGGPPGALPDRAAVVSRVFLHGASA